MQNYKIKFQKQNILHLIILILLIVKEIDSVNLRHRFWFDEWKEEVANPTKSIFTTKNWNYCDLKCFYLENYYDYDFVVISFSEQAYRPNFSACYVLNFNSSKKYIIWDKVIKNKFYESACGMDMEDYLESPEQYKIEKIEGEGRQFTFLRENKANLNVKK